MGCTFCHYWRKVVGYFIEPPEHNCLYKRLADEDARATPETDSDGWAAYGSLRRAAVDVVALLPPDSQHPEEFPVFHAALDRLHAALYPSEGAR